MIKCHFSGHPNPLYRKQFMRPLCQLAIGTHIMPFQTSMVQAELILERPGAINACVPNVTPLMVSDNRQEV
jgi:hypothetical protein